MLFGKNPVYRRHLDVGGDYAYRLRGEDHAWTPRSKITTRYAPTTSGTYELFTRSMNDQNERLLTFRGLFDFNWAEQEITLDGGPARRL